MSNKGKGIKVVLIGDAGVGKTCIISRYIDNKFNEETASTNGGSYCQKTIKIGDKEVLLDIWDTAGQEIYQSLGKHFFRDAEAVCLVYDITNQKSFENLKNNWYEDLQQYGRKDVIIAVVGNKSDLYEKEEITENEGREFAVKINAIFKLTSAQSGTGINKLFESLAEKYFSPEHESKVKEVNTGRTESFLLNDRKNDGCCKKKKCC